MMMKGSRDKQDGREGNSSYCGEPPTLIVNDLNRDLSHHGANELYWSDRWQYCCGGTDATHSSPGSDATRGLITLHEMIAKLQYHVNLHICSSTMDA
jgi:hypothetical protein